MAMIDESAEVWTTRKMRAIHTLCVLIGKAIANREWRKAYGAAGSLGAEIEDLLWILSQIVEEGHV